MIGICIISLLVAFIVGNIFGWAFKHDYYYGKGYRHGRKKGYNESMERGMKVFKMATNNCIKFLDDRDKENNNYDVS